MGFARLNPSYALITDERTKMVEGDLMRAYRNSFGDTPPLNCSY